MTRSRLQLLCGHTLPRALPWAGSSAAGWGEARQFQGTGPGAGLGERVLRQGAGRLRGPALSRRLTPQDHRGGLSGRGPARAGGPGGILRTLASSALPLGTTVATLALALPPTLSRWNHCLSGASSPGTEQATWPGLSLCSPSNHWSELVPGGGERAVTCLGGVSTSLHSPPQPRGRGSSAPGRRGDSGREHCCGVLGPRGRHRASQAGPGPGVQAS